jgi:hypothetical protein
MMNARPPATLPTMMAMFWERFTVEVTPPEVEAAGPVTVVDEVCGRDEELEGSNDCDGGVSEGMDEDVEEVKSGVAEDVADGGTEVEGGSVERESSVAVLGG